MVNNQLKNIKKDGFLAGETTHLKKKSGLNRVLSGRLGHRST
jgi:hypothetical protein